MCAVLQSFQPEFSLFCTIDFTLFIFLPLAGTLGVGNLIADVDGDGGEEVRNGGMEAWRRSTTEKISSWFQHQGPNHFYQSFFRFGRDHRCSLFDRAL
jgi:hypothetical protein